MVTTDFVREYHWSDVWAGGSHAQAFKMARDTGYESAVVEAEKIASEVDQTVAAELFSTTFSATYQCSGAEVDMGRYLSGEPECMIESEPIRISRQGRAVRLAVNVSFVNSIREDVVRKRGAAVLALVDILSRAQHPLEIWACIVPASGDAKRRFVYSIKIQAANEPLDMGRVMYFLAHPTVFRRLGFSVIDGDAKRDDTFSRRYLSGYGTFRGGPENEIQAEDLGEEGGNTIILPLLKDNNGWDMAASIAWVKEELAKIFG